MVYELALTIHEQLGLEEACEALRDEFLDCAHDGSNWGLAKSMLAQMQAEGIDPSAPGALDAWIEAFNARPYQQRDALLSPAADRMVRAAGLDPDTDVKLVDLAVAMQIPAVIGGTVDATLSLEPVGSIAVASGKAARAMTNPVAGVIADPFYSGASIMTAKFLKERPETARKVVVQRMR